MSAHNPWFQFETRLHDSLKTEAKGVFLVRCPWYETSSSLGLPFDVNQSLLFLGWFLFGFNPCSARWIMY